MTESKVEKSKSAGLPSLHRRFQDVEPAPKPNRAAAAKRALQAAEAAAQPLSKPKPRKAGAGRPKAPEKHQPWVEAGLSKSAWYRRQKGK